MTSHEQNRFNICGRFNINEYQPTAHKHLLQPVINSRTL